jgi:hypothetical protein
MEALIAALIGWIDTEDSVIDLRTGLQITNTTENEKVTCEITLPTGDVIEFAGDDADAILDRAEALAQAGKALTLQLNKIAAMAEGGSI